MVDDQDFVCAHQMDIIYQAATYLFFALKRLLPMTALTSLLREHFAQFDFSHAPPEVQYVGQ